MGAVNPRKAVKLAGNGVRPGDEETASSSGKPPVTRSAVPVGAASPGDDYFDLSKYNKAVQEAVQNKVTRSAVPVGPASPGDDYFDLSKYNKVAEALGRPTYKSVDDLERQAARARSIEELESRQRQQGSEELRQAARARSSEELERRQRQQELARRMSAISRSNRRDSRSQFTGDRRPGMVSGPGRSRRMPFRGGFF
jgi:hypothetical protein